MKFEFANRKFRSKINQVAKFKFKKASLPARVILLAYNVGTAVNMYYRNLNVINQYLKFTGNLHKEIA